MSWVEAIRKALRLALEEIHPQLREADRPPDPKFWWEGYVESKLDYKASSDKRLKWSFILGASPIIPRIWKPGLGGRAKD